jgi:hypothetical protein
MADEQQEYALECFDQIWEVWSEEGACDAPGGAEYRRVRNEWIQNGYPTPISTFIRARANIDSEGG